MATNIKFPADLYKRLYEAIMDYGFEPENEDDNYCDMEEIEIDGFFINLRATFNLEFVDDSFSHAFGIEEGHHYEAGDLESIEEVEVWYYDEDDNEYNISELFDYEYFWNQFKLYGVVSKGVQIHYGDEVVVKRNWQYGAWEKMVYLYTDTRLGVHVCARSLGKYSLKNRYKCILPATTGALMIVGKTNYHLQRNV